MSRIRLLYNPNLSASGTFWLLPDGHTIRAKIAEAESTTYTVELQVRFQRARERAIRVSPLDAELTDWLSESCVPHPNLARVTLHLAQVPWDVGEQLLAL